MNSHFNEKTLDTLSVLSDRTLTVSPEPLEPPVRVPRLCIPIAPVGSSKCAHATRVKVRAMTAVALVLWGVNISLSLVESFRLESSKLQFRILLVWATCSGLFVALAAAAFISTLMRLPSRPFVSFLHGAMIVMSATSCIVGFAVLFPVIAECAGSGCSSKERALRLFVCAGVPVGSVWTWVWISSVRHFLHELV
ncbi:hypothetical protein DFH06DRAFT_1162325 [Mycena polygramma]|nr:hypothetical protein DFH06DRAFT_1162325 [Mycena polygramma]